MKFDKFSKVFQIGLVAISSTFVMSLTYAQDAGTRVAVVLSLIHISEPTRPY